MATVPTMTKKKLKVREEIYKKLFRLSENCTKEFIDKYFKISYRAGNTVIFPYIYYNDSGDNLEEPYIRNLSPDPSVVYPPKGHNWNKYFKDSISQESIILMINKAWKEYYIETLQSKINIDLLYTKKNRISFACSPLMMIGKLKEHIKKMFNVNNINYIKLSSRKMSTSSRNVSTHIKYLDNDNYNLYKYGFTDDSKSNTIFIELKVTEEAPSPAPISELIMEPEPEPAAEPEPESDPEWPPLTRPAEPEPESNVIHAELVNSSRNDEITILKTKISELEDRLKKLENWRGNYTSDTQNEIMPESSGGITLNL